MTAEMSSEPVTFEDISIANYRIKDGIVSTMCKSSPTLTDALGMEIIFKHDERQATGSFKERGALNAMLQLSEEQRGKGVIAASAGNHALALAYHGRRLGIPVTVVMPLHAPLTKISNCRAYGATVHLVGKDIAEAKAFGMALVEEKGYTYINGYDDPAIIAGAGTCGLEILEQVKDVDAIIVPVGGGGLIAGISLAVKKMKPLVEVIGVEPINAASFTEALKHGKPVVTKMKPTLADGLFVPMVGANAYSVASRYVDRVVQVNERMILLSVLRLVEEEKITIEGAGATGLAAVLSGALDDLKGKKVCIVLCGGNIDITVLGRVIDRGLACDCRLVKVKATVPDRPGGLAELTADIAATGASVKEITHDRTFLDNDISRVVIGIMLEVADSAHAEKMLSTLQQKEDYALQLDGASEDALRLLRSKKPQATQLLNLHVKRPMEKYRAEVARLQNEGAVAATTTPESK